MPLTTPTRCLANSHALYEGASTLIDAGQTAPEWAIGVEASFDAAPMSPVITKAKGAVVTDVDGNAYIDLTGGSSEGPMILGYAHQAVRIAVNKAMAKGADVGALSEAKVHFANLIADRLPFVEKLHLHASAEQAYVDAVRLVKRATGRRQILRFRESRCSRFLRRMDSIAPESGGASPGDEALEIPYNNVDRVRCVLDTRGGDVAAVFIEPVARGRGLTLPQSGFLEDVRACCTDRGAMLVFEETAAGFRLAPGGAAERFGVRPDLVILGSLVGGGFPLAVVAGDGALFPARPNLEEGDPDGVMGGHSSVLAAGMAVLGEIAEPGFYEKLEAIASRLEDGFGAAASVARLDVRCRCVGSVIALQFPSAPAVVQSPAGDDGCFVDGRIGPYPRFYHAMLQRGVLLPPVADACLFVSAAHGERDIDQIIEAAGESFGELSISL